MLLLECRLSVQEQDILHHQKIWGIQQESQEIAENEEGAPVLLCMWLNEYMIKRLS